MLSRIQVSYFILNRREHFRSFVSGGGAAPLSKHGCTAGTLRTSTIHIKIKSKKQFENYSYNLT